MTAPGSLVWLDGALVPREQARIPIDDFGLRYGLTCFETMLARHGRVFRLDAHLDRLDASLRLFRVESPARADLEDAVAQALRANGLEDASVRLSVTPGRGRRPVLPADGPPAVVVTVDPVTDRPSHKRLWVCAGVRLDSTRAWRGAKVGQFAPYLLARLEAESAGAEDGLLVNERGDLVEASTANLFAVRGDILLTPPLEDGPLPGVTRACVIEVARAAGIEVREAPLIVAEVLEWDAAFLTSSIAGLVPIRSVSWRGASGPVDWHPSGDVPVLQTVGAAYEDLVEAETAGGA